MLSCPQLSPVREIGESGVTNGRLRRGYELAPTQGAATFIPGCEFAPANIVLWDNSLIIRKKPLRESRSVA